MPDLEQIFGMGSEPQNKVEKIITLVERMEKIDRSIDRIKYNEELLLAVPEVIKTLGAAKDAVIAELKTL